MKARKRYLLLIICIAFLTALYLGFVRLKDGPDGDAFASPSSPSHQALVWFPSAIVSLFYSSNSSVSRLVARSKIRDNDLPIKSRRVSYLDGHDVDISSPFRENDQKYLRKGAIWKPIQANKAYFPGLQEKNHIEFAANCRLSNCFDVSKCKADEKIKIHIYPSEEDPTHLSSSILVSPTYQKILNVIRSSIHYEPDPSKACLFVTRYDSLDRDPLSPDFQKGLPQFIPKDNGRNHLVFNLYSGTWPDYHELDFAGFNTGYAMLVKASSSYANYRPGFDVSLPLFSKSHPERGLPVNGDASNSIGEPKEADISITTAEEESLMYGRKSLLVFKGKRYIYGIGSETRNSLHHLHNDNDILMYTTCKHGKKWKELRDDRCEKDNKEYENVDYLMLMSNSTFCLAPRGRRMGSFRFLEALSMGCIPVTLSNDWVKPFNDVIDWSSAAVDGDERLLLQLPDTLRSFDRGKLEGMKSQSLAIYENYFSSVEKIVLTTIAILSERIQSHLSLTSFLWNAINPGFTGFTGAIWFDPQFSQNPADYPGYRHSSIIRDGSASSSTSSLSSQRGDLFTCVIFVNRPVPSLTLLKLAKNMSKSSFIAKILIIWALPGHPPPGLTKSSSVHHSAVPISFVIPQTKTISAKLYPFEQIETDAVLSLDPESSLSSEEVDFAFAAWQAFPHRLVGFSPRDHYYDESRADWYYTSKWTNQYSIILLDAVFYHRYYSWFYTYRFISNIALNGLDNANERMISRGSQQEPLLAVSSSNSSKTNDTHQLPSFSPAHRRADALLYLDDDLCLDLVFNFLVSHITREGPVKVTQRKRGGGLGSSATGRVLLSPSDGGSNSARLGFKSRQRCFSTLINSSFGYLPLIKSQMRLDPVLFKDSVSNMRKKYRKIEQVI